MSSSSSSSPLFTLPIASKGEITCTSPRPSIYLLTFSNPPDNRLITPFCQAFILALDILETKYPAGVVVSTGKGEEGGKVGKFYSNGMDIEHSGFTRGYMPESLYALFRRLVTFGMPTVALINGHAFAGGFMVAMMHDYRIMNPQKGYLCLNELELGMPLRPGMMAVFRNKLPANTLRKLILEAYRFKAAEALAEGLVDHLGGLEECLKFLEERKLVEKAKPGASGKSVYAELKREMWRETVGMLGSEGWAEEAVRAEREREVVRREREERDARIRVWESGKGSKL